MPECKCWQERVQTYAQSPTLFPPAATGIAAGSQPFKLLDASGEPLPFQRGVAFQVRCCKDPAAHLRLISVLILIGQTHNVRPHFKYTTRFCTSCAAYGSASKTLYVAAGAAHTVWRQHPQPPSVWSGSCAQVAHLLQQRSACMTGPSVHACIHVHVSTAVCPPAAHLFGAACCCPCRLSWVPSR
jgi:hypothetical protein